MLNTTIRRGDLKNKMLLIASLAQIASLALRNYQYSVISTFELYFSIGITMIFLVLALQNRNAKSKDVVK